MSWPPLRTLAFTLLGGFLAAILWVFGISTVLHLWNDHQQLHTLIGIVNVNLQQGRLVVPAASAPVPASSPPEQKEP
ncbi:MAG TPA: hypothetical protein VIM84_07415 [Gemmatimonadales bacterium]